MIVGVVGTFASGKDVVGEYLQTRGFSLASCSGMIKEIIAENGWGEPTRDNLREVGNRLRGEHGPGYLAELAIERKHEPLVITGVRTVGEVERIKSAGGIIIAVDAPQEVRFGRAKARGRLDDATTLEEFKRLEAAELSSNDPAHQQIMKVIGMADITLVNDGTLQALEQKIDAAVKELK